MASAATDPLQFAGDALSITFLVDVEQSDKTHGYISRTLAEATNRACMCSLRIHEVMAGYLAIDDPDPSQRVYLSLHMGVGCGKLTAVHVGGIFKRWEYILSGPPMTQIAIAEPLAHSGQTCVSPEAWEIAQQSFEGFELQHDGVLLAPSPHPVNLPQSTRGL